MKNFTILAALTTAAALHYNAGQPELTLRLGARDDSGRRRYITVTLTGDVAKRYAGLGKAQGVALEGHFQATAFDTVLVVDSVKLADLEIELIEGQGLVASSGYMKATVSGNLGSTPEVKVIPGKDGGTERTVTEVSLAATVNRRVLDKAAPDGPVRAGNEWVSDSAWVRLSAWDAASALLAECTKGQGLHIEGTLSAKSYTDNAGNSRSGLKVEVVRLLKLARAPKLEAPEPEVMTPAKTRSRSRNTTAA